MKLSIIKLSKIEKISMQTMEASETFVDALRASADQMMRGMGPPGPPINPDQFNDLRESFEDGIRGFDEEEPEGESEDDNWKKKK